MNRDSVDLDSLISSTLHAIDESSVGDKTLPDTEAGSSHRLSCPPTVATSDIDGHADDDASEEVLQKLIPSPSTAVAESETADDDFMGAAANDPILKGLMAAFASAEGENGDDEHLNSAMDKLLNGILSKDTILESIDQLSGELLKYHSVAHPSDSAADKARFARQLAIYQEVSRVYHATPGSELSESDQDKVRDLLGEVQELGDPPAAVLEVVRGSASSATANPMADDFKSFLQESGLQGIDGLPGLTAEDEAMLKKLSDDPQALSDLFGKAGGTKPECALM